MCKNLCVDEGHRFCPDSFGADVTYGRCCDVEEEDCQAEDLCSSDAPADSASLKYWTCPHDNDQCGTTIRIPGSDGYADRIASKITSDLRYGSICRYKLEFPNVAAEYDRLLVSLSRISNAEVTVVQTLAFASNSFTETILEVGADPVIVPYPYSLYLTVISDFTDDAAEFTIQYWFEDRDPETLTEEELANTGIEVLPKQETIIQEKPFKESPLFFALIALSALALIVAMIFCCCLIVLKRKNDKIQTKVQMLSDLKQDVTLTSDINDQLPATLPVIEDGTLDTQYGLTGLSKEQQLEQMQKLVDAYNQKLNSMRVMKEGQSLSQNDVLEEIDDRTITFKHTMNETENDRSYMLEEATIDDRRSSSISKVQIIEQQQDRSQPNHVRINTSESQVQFNNMQVPEAHSGQGELKQATRFRQHSIGAKMVFGGNTGLGGMSGY